MTEKTDSRVLSAPSIPAESPDNRHERRDAIENRKRILDTARQLFEQDGVEAVSMHQIAQAAGVGQGTLYRHYPHKGELVRDVLAETVGRLMHQVDEYLAQSEATTPALERLSAIMASWVEVMEAKTALMAAIGDACYGMRRAEKFQSPGYQWIHHTLAGLIDEAVTNGELRPVDPTFTADALLAALSPDVYQFQREVRGLSPEQVLEGVRQILPR